MCIIELLLLYIFISILSHILTMHEAMLSLQSLPQIEVQEKLYLLRYNSVMYLLHSVFK
jgi:hypothetical protein